MYAFCVMVVVNAAVLVHYPDGDNSSDTSEVLHIRDSIIGPNNKSDPNRLADWSFMDEKALSAAANGSKRRL
jgi:hypothetical protein